MVQLESDKQVLLFAFLSLLIRLNFVRVCLHVKVLGPTSAARMAHLMETKAFMAQLESFQLETHLIV